VRVSFKQIFENISHAHALENILKNPLLWVGFSKVLITIFFLKKVNLNVTVKEGMQKYRIIISHRGSLLSIQCYVNELPNKKKITKNTVTVLVRVNC
jgi:hypothetical protein